MTIINMLNGGNSVTVARLAQKLERSERMVKRYIQGMREELEMDIRWDAATRSYQCDSVYEYLPILRVTADEALSIALAGKTFAAWQGTALGAALESILKKVGSVMSGAVSVPVSQVECFLSSPQAGSADDREHRFMGELLESIRRGRELKVLYKKPNETQAKERVLWPIHLAFLEQQWALVFWDPGKDAPRKFLLSRIQSMNPTGKMFEPPKSFDVHEYLRGSFGLFTGEETIGVKVRFDAYAAGYLRERQWHPSQQLEELDEGGLLAAYQLNHLMDVQRWVLSWGSHAEVLEPQELREQVKAELEKMLGFYGGTIV